jgi:hypothetical protein
MSLRVTVSVSATEIFKLAPGVFYQVISVFFSNVLQVPLEFKFKFAQAALGSLGRVPAIT